MNDLERLTVDRQHRQTDLQACQTEMMRLFGQVVRQYPHLPTREEQLLRARLMFEEGGVEMIKASGCCLMYKGETLDLDQLTVETIPGDANDADEVAVADAIADTLVVTLGAANTYGQDAYGTYLEVHRSNLSKVWPDGTIHKRDDGKVLKPETYSPANLVAILETQRSQALYQLTHDADVLEEDLWPQNCDGDGEVLPEEER